MMSRGYFFLVLMTLLLGACGENVEDEQARASFRVLDAAQTGLDFSNTLHDTEELNIVEYLYYYNGGGVAIGDVNADGLEDVFLSANQSADRLFINKGNLLFEDVTQQAGILDDGVWSSGVSIQDVNGDGHLDIYVCKVVALTKDTTGHNLLYINDGQGVFREMSEDYGLDFKGFATQACFLDYDLDGDLDVYLLNHSVHSVRSYGDVKKRQEKDPVAGDRFYENRLREEGRFVEVTEQAGIYNSPMGYGLAIAAGDINGDGYSDIYIGNDFHENDYLYINNGDRTFTESIKSYFSHTSQFSMGVDLADMNADGHLDLFSTDMMPFAAEVVLKSAGEDTDQIKRIKKDLGFELQNARNHFQLNNATGQFSDIAYMTGTFATDWSWSVLLQDFDNNQYQDIFITNGIVKRPNDLDYINFLNSNPAGSSSAELIEKMPSQPLRNILFRQNEIGQYSKIEESFLGPPSFSNGAAYADLDKDGDLDIICNNINQPAFLLENKASGHTNYLNISLRGTSSHPVVHGTKVALYLGDRAISREMQTTRGYLSSSTHHLHFGLGDATQVDSLKIQWSDGQVEWIRDIVINKEMIISRGSGQASAPMTVEHDVSSSYRAFALSIMHQENKYYDDNYEKLIPERLSYEGPAVLCEDLNGDGLPDLYLGGGRNQSARLLLGTSGGSFLNKATPDFESDSKYEDIDAATIDFDGDGDRDIYVVSGGNDNKELDKILEDRLYLNNGNGIFRRVPMSLPHTNGSCVSVADLDGDGYEDLFIGSNTIPGSYGLSPYSFILKNVQGRGVEILLQERFGMVNDSQWADWDGDGDMDLAFCGDWMNIRLLENEDGELVEKTRDLGLWESAGFWKTIEFADVNGDGRLDLLAGNVGLNTKWQASQQRPISMYLGDFDKNGFSEPIIFYSYLDQYIPFASLDKLTSQLPLLKKKYSNYASYTTVDDIHDMFENADELIVETKQVKELRSMLYLFENGKFTGYPLGDREQQSSIHDFVIDGTGKIYYVGNSGEYVAELGPSLANAGGVLSGFVPELRSFARSESLPLRIGYNGKHVLTCGDQNMLIVGNQSNPLLITTR